MDLFVICERAYYRILAERGLRRKNFFNYGFLLNKLIPYIDDTEMIYAQDFKKGFKTKGAEARQEWLWSLVKEILDKELN